MELATGRVVQGWRVEAVVGRGAMAVVYRVRHAELGSVAALKVLDRLDPEVEQRLVREGRAQSSVGHPGVVQVFDLFRVDEHAALLLEYVPGPDLSQRLAHGPPPRDVGFDLFRQVVAAVGAAHAAGLVHRDLKPSNVLVTDTGDRLIAKVGDFGVAKAGQLDPITLTHALLGTPRYMAPEQMRSAHQVDRRADVFALGCLLFELLTGRPPYEGHDLVALYAAKMSGRRPPLPDDVPAEVRAALDGCLEGPLARRIPSCDVLLEVLDGGSFEPTEEVTFDGDRRVAICPSCGAAGREDPCATCGVPVLLGGRFRLQELVSSGALTRVWRGVDLREARFVAARALAPSADPGIRERFDRGVRVLSELSHPQIVRVLVPPFDEHGFRWEIREWVDGESLRERMTHHRFSEVEVRTLLRGLVAPLAYLAERRPPVVHRSIGPENVIVTPEGRCVLIDFAQVRDRPDQQSLDDRPATAPEQWVGEATPATDVFGLGSLGTTLLARSAGGPLAKGPGLPALLRRMTADEPARRPPLAVVARELARPARRDPDAQNLLWLGVMFAIGVLFALIGGSIPLLWMLYSGGL